MSINYEMTSLADAVRDITDEGGLLTIGEMTTALIHVTRDYGSTIVPTSYDQTAVSSGTLMKGDIIVQGEPNLIPENIAEGISIFGIEGTHSGDVGMLLDTCDVTVDLSRLYDIIGMISYTGVGPSGTLAEPIAYGIRDSIWDCTAVVGSCLVVWMSGCHSPTIEISNSDVTVLYNSWNRYDSEHNSYGVIAFGLSNSLVGPVTITLSTGGDVDDGEGGFPDELPEV